MPPAGSDLPSGSTLAKDLLTISMVLTICPARRCQGWKGTRHFRWGRNLCLKRGRWHHGSHQILPPEHSNHVIQQHSLQPGIRPTRTTGASADLFPPISHSSWMTRAMCFYLLVRSKATARLRIHTPIGACAAQSAATHTLVSDCPLDLVGVVTLHVCMCHAAPRFNHPSCNTDLDIFLHCRMLGRCIWRALDAVFWCSLHVANTQPPQALTPTPSLYLNLLHITYLFPAWHCLPLSCMLSDLT